MAEQRFRVRKEGQTFADRGPDLLRQRNNAVDKIAALMGMNHFGWSILKNGDESPTMPKAEALQAFVRWTGHAKPDDTIRFIHESHQNIAVRYAPVKLLAMADCSPATILLHSLVHEQFPTIKFAGGYVYKKIEGTESWSDHAYGTAFDETENPPQVKNDDVLDWLARMGRANCTAFGYALGSRDGKIVEVYSPDYDIEPSGAASSHLWHVHVSVVNHHGVKPPHEGGVF